ncbi:GATA transcription factor 4-like [Miscanthus floridulus]|uniref:GATA transcription factor 4-like n=1 Tax=Miscanthus floridulus TaxID=154761 RepID=UPI003459F695
MASEWEMATGVDPGMGMGTYHHNASSITTAPMSSHHSGGACYSTAHHHHYYGMPPMGDTMSVDDLSTGAGAHEFFPTAATDKQGHHSGAMMGEPSPTANSSDHQTSSLLSFADEFYIPSEEVAELEWLSKFVDDSYSDMPNYSSAAHAAMAAAANAAGSGGGTSAGQDSCVTAAPGRGARSKRSSRATAAAWHSLVPRPPSQSSPSPSSCSLSSDFPSSNSNKPARPNGGSRGKKSPAGPGGEVGMDEGGVRRCTHCASEQTPQWRSGPLGPKTLCNACGVRFKSGRLMPEYRPAASPTFVLTEHSNSHRKVVELRRQKELILIRGTHRDAAAGSAGGPRPELMFRDYGGVC